MIEIPTRPDFTAQKERTDDGTHQPCIVCGRCIKQPRYWLHVHCGGNHAVTEAEAVILDPGADLGLYPVGPDCLRRCPELRPYVQRWEGAAS